MSDEWLNPDESSIIPFNSRIIIEQMVSANLALIFDNTESPIAGTMPPHKDKPYSWVMRIQAPIRFGGRVELFVTDNPKEYELLCSQMQRYIRYLMKQYPYYNPTGGG